MVLQKPNAKKTSLEQWAQDMGDGVMRWLIGLTRHWSKRRDILRNNYRLGHHYLKLGKTSDAVLRFKIVTWMDPMRPDGWYFLGCSTLAHGDRVAAVSAFTQALRIKPDYEEAAYMLAIASGKDMPAEALPKKMPVSLAQGHFEEIAPGFTREQIEVYQYRGHTLLAEAVRAALVPGRIDHVVLEPGVGSGLCGALLRDVSAHLTGVDFSAAMLTEAVKLQDAQGKKTYDALINREIHEFLPDMADDAFDVVLAAGLISYVGEADALVAQVARVLKPGGLFAFTADAMDGQGFQLDTAAGRFCFSRSYLEGLAANNRLTVLRFEEAEIYPEYKAWLCVFRK
ncbi:MAG: methyltransferase domain-containing protein [Pseudomonadota bacterium]|nr:methyltransferase domain-containing protein [Pseudomonadota bacterium]MDE3038153.1 methyltransferase domain-containing protein [Pseudomonadota bacterium]